MTVLTRGAFPASALLHERLRAAHVARLPAVPRVDGAGAHAADVRCEEHDVRCRRRSVSGWLCSFQMYFDLPTGFVVPLLAIRL